MTKLLTMMFSSLMATVPLVHAQETQPWVKGPVAKILLEEQLKEIVMIKMEPGTIHYTLPNTPGAMTSISMALIKEIKFIYSYDDYAVFKAVEKHQWSKAGTILFQTVTPFLPFLGIPGNNLSSVALDAGMYLQKAGAREQRLAKGRLSPKASNYYKKALYVLDAAGKSEWFLRSKIAKQRAIQCLIQLRRMEEARDRMESALVPEVGDIDIGLYWLTRAGYYYVQKQIPEALDAANQSILFKTKDIETFPDALLLSARCYEHLEDFHRARDVYFEVARLFIGTEWGEIAAKKLTKVMAQEEVRIPEIPNIAKIFFNVDEDMNELVNDLLEKRKTDKAIDL